MPRQFIRRYLPDPAEVRRYRSLRPLANFLHEPNLWALNRRSVARAVFVGMSCAFIPLPIQMFFAAAFSIVFRCNLPLAMATVWISNPLTFVPIFGLAYWVGALLLGIDNGGQEITSNSIWSDIGGVGQPLLLGCVVCGAVSGVVSWAVVNFGWRIAVARRWASRRSSEVGQS